MPILSDNSGFSNWKYCVKLVLDEKQLLETTEINVEEIAEDKEKKGIPQEECQGKNDARYAKDMLKSLEEVFERKSMFSKSYLKKKLLALKFKPKEKLEEHFLRFYGLVRDLENAGAKMDDTDKIYHLLLTMGDNFNTVITAIETMKQDLTMEFVKCRLLEEEKKQVLNLPFSEGKCPQCLEGTAKRLHFKKNEKSTQSSKELLHSDIVELSRQRPKKNSKAERMNLMLMNKVRAKFAETDLPRTIWGEAARASAYELNRSPTSALQNRTPASVWFGENYLSKLRVFASQAYMLKLPRERKLEPRAKSMIMVGYSAKKATRNSLALKPQTKKRSKPNRTIKKPSHLQEYELYMAYCLCAGEPQDYEDDIKLGKGWEEAIECEVKALELHQTWTPTVLPPGEKAIETKWIFKTKKDGLKKARLVAKGFQEEPANNVYAPVAKLPTICLLISLAVSRKWEIRQLDVPTAFLNGYVDDDIYIRTPDGVKNEPGKALKLKRSLYGLHSAPRKCNERFHNFMETHGMKRSASDFCLYIGENVRLIICVDDMLITGEKTQVENLIRLLDGEFKAKDLGILSEFLGTMVVNDGDESATSTPVLLTDNQSAIDMAESFENSRRSRYIDIKFHYFKDLVYKKRIKINYVSSENITADIMTKALCQLKFEHFRNKLNVK
ncbi:hypothetical protein PR048_012845 [Dryococelus australis]|uniref:Reverse transcriptase Ty1/copia-type domain-containing protein n=1 Tax=Dryococelus australis TaxID=614101 RepID=A0ABQ9HQH6_9NEOP|nr:hypothetical protein PR048_012845 [Dryococelus australis]